jgi:DNA-binding MarR family transcriptional regulator
MADVLKMAKTIASECVAHRARQVARVLTRAYDESIRSLGIQISQLILLVAIADAGDEGAPIGQIAKVVLMDQTTLSRNIVPLEKAGLVKLMSSPRDARSRVVVLTGAGKRMIKAAYPRWKAAQREVRRLVGAARFEALHDDLGAIVGIAEDLPG